MLGLNQKAVLTEFKRGGRRGWWQDQRQLINYELVFATGSGSEK
jgi:hypothetical protein